MTSKLSVILLLLMYHGCIAQKSAKNNVCLTPIPMNESEQKPVKPAKNVLNTDLKLCCASPKTGYYRDGFCTTGQEDQGRHVVCAIVSQAFLDFSKSRGNDLITPVPEYNFPGLKAGDKWCLCALRWKEALEANVAPPIVLESTHIKALQFLKLDDLKKHTQ